MSSPTSPQHRPTRSVSNASSGDRTVCPRRSSTASALSDDAVPEIPEDVDGPGLPSDATSPMSGAAEVGEAPVQPPHPSAWGPHVWGDAELKAPPPPPLWRQASDQTFSDSEDPEQGPSDYWRRQSPALSPVLPTAPTDPWLQAVKPELSTPEEDVDTDGENADTAEYSRRLEQVLSLADQSPTPSPTRRRERNRAMFHTDAGDGSADEGSALWSGKGYDDAVRDVLRDAGDGDAADTPDEKEEDEFGALPVPAIAKDSPDDASASIRSPSTTSLSASVQERLLSPTRPSPSGPSRSYIHPSVSRLRSQPHVRNASTSTHLSASTGAGVTNHTRVPSHFSQVSLSRSDSFSTASLAGPSSRPVVPPPEPQPVDEDMKGPAFTFHPLRHLSAHLFNRRGERERDRENGASSPTPRPSPAKRAGSILGVSLGSREAPVPPTTERVFGAPTVMDTNGMIAVGTQGGYIVVYGFNQEVRCVLGNETTTHSGPVTAVTICPDQTWIGVGHASGNIYLWDLAHPSKPARTTLAVTLAQVLSGRKEGHLQGTRILHIGFVGKRHTSIVTGDEEGRAFWFSLGRVMGVDSNDVVRMLGSYPEREQQGVERLLDSPRADEQPTSAPGSLRSNPAKKSTTLFAALPLPHGSMTHSTDQFHISALLTPVKLVVVGMKPSAKTWFRKMRDSAGGEYGGYVGCAAWLKSGEVTPGTTTSPPSDPVLAYSWGTSLRFLRIRVSVTQPPPKKSTDGKSDKKPPAPVSTPEFIEGRRWDAPHPIQSLHWFDQDHLLMVTNQEILLVNVRTMKAVENTPLQTKLLMSQDFYSSLSLRKSKLDAVPPSIASSTRTFREKLFLLTKANVQVGTLQHWNDRVLASVHRGDFLAAINLALAYYEGRATGNTIGLPEDPGARRDVVGTRVRELMRASLDWAFSEERMHDDTHFSADGRGVDLTSLFEGLAGACIDACLAMQDSDFLFDEGYEHFSNAGIQNIFLQRLEGYIFEDRLIGDVPPNVVQALIAMHDQAGEYGLAEAIIWHIAPSSLDINQAVTLCQAHGLWDALIYVYTRAMGDYAAPIVKLIGIVCDIQRARRQRPSLVGAGDNAEERLAPDAYKLYGYVANVLSGLWYPSGEAMRDSEATKARNEAYGLIFSDRTVEWPTGSNELVLTDQSDEGGIEHAYPYLRLLLQFDTEAFLHAMDLAFEDSYLNDSARAINRQTIINLMLDVMESGFHSSDVTFLHIFVARNLPKYPQFIFIPPSTSHRILLSLASDPDQSTREDRQLAAEYLLSAYTPHDADEMLGRFEKAGFFRILRAAYRRDRKWGALIDTLLKDPDADDGVFANLDEIITASKTSLGIVPTEVNTAMSNALPHLFDLSVGQTARLLDRSLPTLHEAAVSALDSAPHKQAAYLRILLDPQSAEDEAVSEAGADSLTSLQPSRHIHTTQRHKYVALLAAQDSGAVITFLDKQGAQAFDLPLLAQQFEDAGVPEGQLWALDRNGQTKEVFSTIDGVLASRGADLAEGIKAHAKGDIHLALTAVTSVAGMAIRLCREHSSSSGEGGKRKDVEDMWFGVLHSITELVHSVSALAPSPSDTSDGGRKGDEDPLAGQALEALRLLVQDTLQALLSTSSANLSFARLFKRLVEAAPSNTKSKGKKKGKGGKEGKGGGARAYSEFRAILGGMLDSFRQDSEVLSLSIRLVDADMFDLLDERFAKSQAGWRPTSTVCAKCDKALWNGDKVALRADGRAVHVACEPAITA